MGFKMKGPSMYPNYKKAKNGGIMVNRSGNPGAADGRAASSPFQMKTDPPTDKAKKHRDNWQPAYEGADYSKKDISTMSEKEKIQNIDGYEPAKKTTEKRTMKQRALKKASGAAKKGMAEAAGEAVTGLAIGAAAGKGVGKKLKGKKGPALKAKTDTMKAHGKLTKMNSITGEKKVVKGGEKGLKRTMTKNLKTKEKSKMDSLKEGAKRGWTAAKKGVRQMRKVAVKSGKLATTGPIKPPSSIKNPEHDPKRK